MPSKPLKRLNRWLAPADILAVAGVAVVLMTRLEERRKQQRFAVLDRYCAECHNPAELAGELSFEGLSLRCRPIRRARVKSSFTTAI